MPNRPVRSSALIYAAVPPPITGQSLCSAMLIERMGERGYPHAVVDLSRPFHTGWFSVAQRAARVAELPVRGALAFAGLPGTPVTYLHLGGSLRSMLRDLPLIHYAVLRGSPVVAHMHGACYREAYEAAPASVRWAVKRAMAKLSRVIILGQSLGYLFEGLVPQERVVVIDNGVERSVAERGAAAPIERNGRGLKVLYMSNLIAAKGYGAVMEAARLSRDRGLPHRFAIVGLETDSMDERPDAFARRHALDNLTWPGGVSGIAKLDYFEDADVVVLPSDMQEGQPLTLLEAMHFGRPVVTTARGGIADLIIDQEHGVVVPPRDPEAILAALEQLDPPERWRTIAEHNRGEAQRRFTLEAHGDAVISLLDEVAAEGPVWRAPDAN